MNFITNNLKDKRENVLFSKLSNSNAWKTDKQAGPKQM